MLCEIQWKRVILQTFVALIALAVYAAGSELLIRGPTLLNCAILLASVHIVMSCPRMSLTPSFSFDVIIYLPMIANVWFYIRVT